MGLFTDDLSNDIDHLQHTRKKLRIVLLITAIALLVLSIFLIRYYLIANKTTKTIKTKVEKAVKEGTTKKETELKAFYEKKIADEAANPWQGYVAEDIFGAFNFKFPKNWHTNVTKDLSVADQFRFLADPNWFTNTVGEKGPFTALEVKVINKKYERMVEDFQDLNRKKSLYKISDASISNISGKRLEWKNDATSKKAVFLILPFRDKTVYIGTEKYDELGSTFEEILKNFVLNK